ncbi:hypothetical protein AAMO2058_000864200 [Amorphochlora amoebiformis]
MLKKMSAKASKSRKRLQFFIGTIKKNAASHKHKQEKKKGKSSRADHRRRQSAFAMTMHAKQELGGNSDDVKLPPGENEDEWLATATVEVFNQVLTMYGSLYGCCTSKTCPKMTADKGFRYAWRDNNKYKKPKEVSAPDYIILLFDWVEEKIQNPKLFPTNPDTPFPEEIRKEIKNIFKRLFRVYAHIYYKHFKEVEEVLTIEALNSCFKYFVLFCIEFNLIRKEEMNPMKDLLKKWGLWKVLKSKQKERRRKEKEAKGIESPGSRESSRAGSEADASPGTPGTDRMGSVLAPPRKDRRMRQGSVFYGENYLDSGEMKMSLQSSVESTGTYETSLSLGVKQVAVQKSS